MRNILKFIGLFSILVLVFSACTGDSEQTTLERIRERGYIIVGTFGDRPPYGYVAADGTIQGLDPFISRRFAYELFGDENAIEFVITEAANRIPFLQSNQVDLIMATFTDTAERRESVHFALPYMRTALGIAANENTDIQYIEDLYGRNLVVTMGTTAQIYFTQNHPEINLLSFSSNTESFAALTDGRADAMAHDDTLLVAWVADNPGHIMVAAGIGDESYLAPAVNLNSEDLLEWLNETILNLRTENFFYQAYDATLREAFSPETNPSDVMVN